MKKTVLTFVLVVSGIAIVAQPFTPSELAWPSRSGSGGSAVCTALANNSFISIAENTPDTVTLHGGGGTFSILSSPTSGSLSGLDTVAGTVTYTPNLNFIGSDSFTFRVQNGTCSTNATVYIGVFDTNSFGQTCVTVSGVSTIDTTEFCVDVYTNGVLASSGCDTTSTGADGLGGTICVNRGHICNDPGFVTYVYAANGGTYTTGLSGNHINLDGHNPGVPGAGTGFCVPPAQTTVSFSICNNEATNRTFVMFGTLDYGNQTVGGTGAGAAANLDVNGFHFTFTGIGAIEHLDCNTGVFTGSGAIPYTISNGITVTAGTSLHLVLSTRIYRNDTGNANDQSLRITNFWK
jgi:hypothetical protein